MESLYVPSDMSRAKTILPWENRRCYAIVTDGYNYEFISYDPISKAFTHDERMYFNPLADEHAGHEVMLASTLLYQLPSCA
jgi:hypothetical protein